MMRRLAAALAVAAVAAGAAADTQRALTHRVWLLGGVPEVVTLAALRGVGIAGVVLPVGRVELGGGSSRFTLTPLPDLRPLAGWPVTALVWVDGQGRSDADSEAFASEVAPVLRAVPGARGLLLAARRLSPGAVALATGVAARLGLAVELAAPAQELARAMPSGGWRGVTPVAVALGTPETLGFPVATVQDDLAALDALDAAGVTYRVAVVIVPHAEPSPGPAGGSLARLAGGDTAVYAPGERGDTFRLLRPVDWGGIPLSAGQQVTVEATDTAHYDHDLGRLLRPVRNGLAGWDTVGLPAPEPALGMSLEAFLDYLGGGSPYPVPQIGVTWAGPSKARLTLTNPTAQVSALATTGNWVELRFTGTEVRDAQLGQFSGVEFGAVDADGSWHRAALRGANAVRLYLTFVPPRDSVSGAVVSFISRPRSLAAGWRMRLGDGGTVASPLQALPLTSR